jgi:hypothetical protein
MSMLSSQNFPLEFEREKYAKIMECVKSAVDLFGFEGANVAIKDKIAQILLQFILTLKEKGELRPFNEDFYRRYVFIKSLNEVYLKVQDFYLQIKYEGDTITLQFKTDAQSTKQNLEIPSTLLIPDGEISFNASIPNEIKFDLKDQTYTSVYDERGIEYTRLINYKNESKDSASVYRSNLNPQWAKVIATLDKKAFQKETYVLLLGNSKKYPYEIQVDYENLVGIMDGVYDFVRTLPNESELVFPTPYIDPIMKSVREIYDLDQIPEEETIVL